MSTSFPDRKVVVLAGPGESTDILFHYLDQKFGVHHLIVETPVGQRQLLRRRVEKLGWGVVLEALAMVGLFRGLIAEIEVHARPTHIRNLAHPVT